MKILFWNIKDFVKPSRRKHIKDFIKQEGLAGIGLQETMKRDFTQSELGEISGGGGGFQMGVERLSWSLRWDTDGGQRGLLSG
jgi:hypothetical protein